jgi:NADPH:quinone reductase-like Zn-dependent oxidoreductase
MQACIYEEYGPANVVRLGEVERPVVKADDVLVRVHATSVTTADWRFRAAAFPRGFRLMGRLMLGLFRPRNPVLGMDFSGVVEATGKNVTRFHVGEQVFGAASPMRRGAHAEYVAVKESGAMLRKPACLTHQEAAGIPFGGNSALAFLRDFGRVAPGQRVLVVGASGGTGIWAVQIARHLGAEVTGVCSTRNVELVRSLRAHHVVDYTSGAIAEKGVKYDLIFDTVGVTTFAECKDALADKGTYLPLNSGLREIGQALLTSRSAGQRVKYAVSQNTREGLELLVNLIESGDLKPVIDQVYPMEQIADAHRHVEGRHKRGSVVVTMGDPSRDLARHN